MSPVLSIGLVLLNVVSFSLQARRIRQVGAAGVSRSAWVGLLVSVTLWTAYGLAVHDWTIAAANAPLVLVAVVILRAMVRAGAARRSDPWAFGLGTVVAASVGIALVGPAAAGSVAATIVVARILPQLVAAVRSRDVAGISIGTWLGNIANKVPWTLYGLAVADVWMTWGAAIAVVLSLAIVLVVLARRRTPVPA